jgi:hypothetical protein
MLKKILALGLAALLLSPLIARADKEQLAQQSVEINSSAKAVWALIKDFGRLQNWHPAFSNSVIKSGRKNAKGAIRTVTINGESYNEELLKFDDKKMFFRYRILGDSPFPVTDYVSTMYVTKGNGGKTKVLWQGKFKNKPGSGKTDAEVVDLLSGTYKEGLDNLKALAEAS